MASAGLRSGGCFVVGLQFMDGVIQTDLFVPNGTHGKKRGTLVSSKSACCIERTSRFTGGGVPTRQTLTRLVSQLLYLEKVKTRQISDVLGGKPSDNKSSRRLQLGLVGTLFPAGGTSHLLLWDVPLGVPRDVFDFRDDVWYSWRCRECP